MDKVERARKGGSSCSEAKRAASARNLARARAERSRRAALPYPVRWLLRIFNEGRTPMTTLEWPNPNKLEDRPIDALRRSWAEAHEEKRIS